VVAVSVVTVGMIPWRTVPGGYDAGLVVRGTAIAKLRARPTRWEALFVGGSIGAPAASVGHARRAVLQSLVDAFRKLEVTPWRATHGIHETVALVINTPVAELRIQSTKWEVTLVGGTINGVESSHDTACRAALEHVDAIQDLIMQLQTAIRLA